MTSPLVSHPADLAGDINVGVSSLADLAGGVTAGVTPSAVAGVVPPADLAEISHVIRTSGPDEPVTGIAPILTGTEECDICENAVALCRTGSDEPINCVVRTSGPDEPVADEDIYNVVSTSTLDKPV